MNGGEKAVETIRMVSAWLTEGRDPATFEPVRTQIEATDVHDIAMAVSRPNERQPELRQIMRGPSPTYRLPIRWRSRHRRSAHRVNGLSTRPPALTTASDTERTEPNRPMKGQP